MSTADSGHGRSEQRDLSATVTDAQAADFPEARQLVKVRNRTTDQKSGEADDAPRHFITSLSPTEANAHRLQRTIRSHWGCESRHWQGDASWGEDRCRLRHPNAACALALIRTTLQSLVRWIGGKGLPAVFEDVAHDLGVGLDWLDQRHFRQ